MAAAIDSLADLAAVQVALFLNDRHHDQVARPTLTIAALPTNHARAQITNRHEVQRSK
jgi:hypothetical protein